MIVKYGQANSQASQNITTMNEEDLFHILNDHIFP